MPGEPNGVTLRCMSLSGFGRLELPYGVGTVNDGPPRVWVAVRDRVIDLTALSAETGVTPALFAGDGLLPLLAAGRAVWESTRAWLQRLVADDDPVLDRHARGADLFRPVLPFPVADYVDFYASPHHATHLGRMFRPDQAPLTPNWWHLPIGYHGRAGTVVVSGTPVARPSGQSRPPGTERPVLGPTAKLDLEAELGWVVGGASGLGRPVPTDRAADHLFGVVVLNDWSARDLQAWEYVPLGPFLGKSFATSISAWVLPIQALADAAVPLPPAAEPRLPYLQDPATGYDLLLEVRVNGTLVATCPYREMAWAPEHFVAHTTVNGAGLRPGDLLGSGTVSGPDPGTQGSLIELTWNGTRPLTLDDGSTRTFLQDGDEVVLTACTARGPQIRLGEVRGTVTADPYTPAGGTPD